MSQEGLPATGGDRAEIAGAKRSEIAPLLRELDRFSGAAPNSAEGFFAIANEYQLILRRYKWVVVSIVLAALAIGGARTLIATRLYTANVRIQIDRSVAKIVQNGDITPVESGDFEFLRTQFELLQSRSLVERAVSMLDLADDPDFATKKQPSLFARFAEFFVRSPPAPAADRAELERELTDRIMDSRVVRLVPGSRLFDIAYTDASPLRSQAITAGLADSFVAWNLDKRGEANAYAKTFLEDQLKQLQIKLQDSEKTLIDFGQREQIIGSTDKTSIAESNLAAANATLDAIVTDRMKNEQQYQQVAAVNVASFPQFLTDKMIEELRSKRNALVSEYQEKEQTLKPSFPEMIQIDNQIKETDRQIGDEIRMIKSSLKGAYEASLKQEEAMKSRIEALRTEVLDLQKRGIQYNIYKREADSNRALYESLLQRYKEVDVAGGIGANNVFIIDRAELPTRASSPNVFNNMVISLILGMIAAVSGAVLLERLDNTVTRPDQLEHLTGLPTLGVIPKIAGGKTIEEEIDDRRSAIWEAYRTLCTSLQFSTDKGLPKSLLFTSANASEGKSTSSLVVAKHFASIGLRVLLIDGDLRKPSLHAKMGLDNSSGLTNYLTGTMSHGGVAQSTVCENLSFIASGPLPPNASDLLASPRLGQLLTAANEVFDLVVIDGPPIMGLADAPLLSNVAAGTVFVTAAGRTPKQSVRRALKRMQFARSNIVGAALMRYDLANEGYGYGYASGYGYGYGSRQHGDPDAEKESDTARLPSHTGADAT
jgi:capsular exopolysaccharide synthesis family protein